MPDDSSATFTDNDVSGATDATERKAFGRLIAAVKAAGRSTEILRQAAR